MEKDEAFRVFCYWQHELNNVELSLEDIQARGRN